MKKLLIMALGSLLVFGACTTLSAKETIELSNKDKAKAILNSLSNGEEQIIKKYVTENYIEHNSTRKNGRITLINEANNFKEMNTKIDIVRVFEDGDKVFIHSEYLSNDKSLVAFDIFRFENGLIVEHWDNFEIKGVPNLSNRTQTDGPIISENLNLTLENKKLIENVVNDVLMGHNPSSMPSYFDGNNYIQHKSGFGDGVDTAIKGMKKMALEGTASKYTKIHQVLGEGNFVLTVSEGKKGATTIAFYDLFRIENKKIAEHWDILEIVPEDKVDKKF